MQFHQSPAASQPYAQAAVSACRCALRLAELVEDDHLLRQRHAQPGVSHRDGDRLLPHPLNRTSHLDLKRYLAPVAADVLARAKATLDPKARVILRILPKPKKDAGK